MEVKKNYPEYNDWLTESQWEKQYKVIIDKTKAVKLWSNQFCVCSSLYAAPDNVRDMTEPERTDYQNKVRQLRKKYREDAKQKRDSYKRKLKYAGQLRKEWHTKWQWLGIYHRKIVDEAAFKAGKTLNNYIGRDWYVFASDYCYFHINNTRLITDENEFKKLVDESTKRYYENLVE